MDTKEEKMFEPFSTLLGPFFNEQEWQMLILNIDL